MLILSSTINQEAVSHLNKRNPTSTLRGTDVSYVIQLYTTFIKKNQTNHVWLPQSAEAVADTLPRNIQLAQNTLPFTTLIWGFLAWANTTLPKLSFTDDEQNQKLILPQKPLQLASALSVTVLKMQQAATPLKAAQHSPWNYPAAVILQQVEPRCTRLASSTI